MIKHLTKRKDLIQPSPSYKKSTFTVIGRIHPLKSGNVILRGERERERQEVPNALDTVFLFLFIC
jgi:hypothetical protein